MRLRRHPWLAYALALGACQSGTRDAAGAPAAVDSSGDRLASTPKADITSTPLDSSVAAWKITPGQFGSITSHTSEADLRRRYQQSVDTTRVQLGEGETTPGTILFPGDSLQRAEIIWQDTVNRRQPARVILRGDRSRWQLSHGITLGTTLQELERLNGRPFTLAGFGWDYAGVITDWKGGALDSALAGIKLYLDPGPAQYESAPYSQVLGDRDYASSLPAMQQLRPKVTQIFVDFDQP
jgi:hypothetical protein